VEGEWMFPFVNQLDGLRDLRYVATKPCQCLMITWHMLLLHAKKIAINLWKLAEIRTKDFLARMHKKEQIYAKIEQDHQRVRRAGQSDEGGLNGVVQSFWKRRKGCAMVGVDPCLLAFMEEELETPPAPPTPPSFKFGIPSEVLPNESFKPISCERREVIPEIVDEEADNGGIPIDDSAWEDGENFQVDNLQHLEGDNRMIQDSSRPTTAQKRVQIEPPEYVQGGEGCPHEIKNEFTPMLVSTQGFITNSRPGTARRRPGTAPAGRSPSALQVPFSPLAAGPANVDLYQRPASSQQKYRAISASCFKSNTDQAGNGNRVPRRSRSAGTCRPRTAPTGSRRDKDQLPLYKRPMRQPSYSMLLPPQGGIDTRFIPGRFTDRMAGLKSSILHDRANNIGTTKQKAIKRPATAPGQRMMAQCVKSAMKNAPAWTTQDENTATKAAVDSLMKSAHMLRRASVLERKPGKIGGRDTPIRQCSGKITRSKSTSSLRYNPHEELLGMRLATESAKKRMAVQMMRAHSAGRL
jgi:hypothetical protein